MIETTFIIRVVTAIILLAIASRQDIKKKEVSDWIWEIMLLIGFSLLIGDTYNGHIGILELFMMGMLILVAYVIFIGFNKGNQDAFGGADAKAFMCLAILFPIPLLFGALPFSYIIIIWAELFSFSVYFPKASRLPREEWKNIKYPLIPFILFGVVFGLLIYIIEQSMMGV